MLWLVFLEDRDRVLSICRISFKYRKESCCFEEFTTKKKSPEKKFWIPSVWCVFCVQKKKKLKMLYPHIVGQFSEMWKNICLTIACAQQLVLFFFLSSFCALNKTKILSTRSKMYIIKYRNMIWMYRIPWSDSKHLIASRVRKYAKKKLLNMTFNSSLFFQVSLWLQ